MDLKGTRTEANLRSAFAGETQARSKYDYFAKAAEKEGFQQIAAIPPTTRKLTRSSGSASSERSRTLHRIS